MNEAKHNELNIPSGYHLYPDVKPPKYKAISPVWDWQDDFHVHFREILWMGEGEKHDPQLIAWEEVSFDNRPISETHEI